MVVDGEIVAFDGAQTSFARLQQRGERPVEAFLYVFDILHLAGYDTGALPLRARKGVLRRALAFSGPIRLTPYRNRDGEALFRRACAAGWEGLIAKRADAPYTHGRSRDWLKFKCSAEQELVIGGYTAPRGSRTDLGALLLGHFADGRLRYAGKVGTGFTQATLRDLAARLGAAAPGRIAVRRRAAPARRHLGGAAAGGAGGLHRVDARRPPAPSALPRAARRQGRRGGGARMSDAITIGRRTIPISHADRVVWPDDGLTKGDLARHYADVADVMVPPVRERALATHGFPHGIAAEGFFIKDAPRHFPGVDPGQPVPKREGGAIHHVLADDAATLVYLAGQNVVTAHVWTSRADRLERPDRLVFDLDPARRTASTRCARRRGAWAGCCARSASRRTR